MISWKIVAYCRAFFSRFFHQLPTAKIISLPVAAGAYTQPVRDELKNAGVVYVARFRSKY